MPGSDFQAPAGAFHTTHWSVVLAAGEGGSAESTQALEQLCRDYWAPLCGYIRGRGRSDADARDLTQEFFARILAKDYLRRADRERGRFRTFLLTSLKHFLVNEWERERAARRGGGAETLSLHEDGMEERVSAGDGGGSPGSPGSELLFDQHWAAALIEQTLTALRTEHVNTGRPEQFEALKSFIGAGPELPPSHDQAAAQLGLSPGAVRVAVHRLRERYRELLRAAVARTVRSPAEVDDELHHLINVIRAA